MKFLTILAVSAYSQLPSDPAIRLEEVCMANKECIDAAVVFSNGTTRAMTSAMDAIWDYGCWCFFQSEGHGKGKGQVQNVVDGICQVLHHGYSCIKMDAIDVDDMLGCNPFTHSYNLQQTLGNSEQQLEMRCVESNPGDRCAQAICLVEAKFILNFIQIGTTPGFVFDGSLKHDTGNFSMDMCTLGANGGLGFDWPEDMCCGEYPLRFPMKSKDGARGCCGSNTYNTTLLECCSDGTINVSC